MQYVVTYVMNGYTFPVIIQIKRPTDFYKAPAPNGSAQIAQKKSFPLLVKQKKNRKYIAENISFPIKLVKLKVLRVVCFEAF